MIDAEVSIPSSPLKFAVLGLAAGFAITIMVTGTIILVTPRAAQATPQFAAKTHLPCGRCHVNPAGGGPRTAFGKAFQANGFKVPKKHK